ncbi:coiled-coil domain-containing protein 106b isoform X4 [Brachyhypopomus gauderio]|uniref:coiled-coil domain-containing protein 106b isoform X4 n=1 Tax=Brachyhypopomus gauderio TaxID=698409 RepID=UPI0040430DB3
MTDIQRSTRNSADLKNEDGYEISIPFEDNSTGQSSFYNQNDHVFVETASGQTPCNPYLLISNLRAQLQISLEKNSWLQKRIEDLEEERDFLRCQLDRFIFTTKSQERCDEEEEEVIEAEEYLEDGYLEEEQILTDDDDDDSDNKSSRRSRASSRSKCGQMRVKRTRVFRIARGMERQRVKDPAGVLLRYKKILVTYQKLKSMSRAFQVHGVDRNTVASTTPIAELLLVAPEKVADVGEFDSSKEKLLDYARRCYKALDEPAHAKVQALKKNNLLLPISYRFRN